MTAATASTKLTTWRDHHHPAGCGYGVGGSQPGRNKDFTMTDNELNRSIARLLSGPAVNRKHPAAKRKRLVLPANVHPLKPAGIPPRKKKFLPGQRTFLEN
jgi:hypothetical protein